MLVLNAVLHELNMAWWNKKPSFRWFGGLIDKVKNLVAPAVVEPEPELTEESRWVELELGQLLNSDPDQPMHIVSMREYSAAIGENWDLQGPKIMTMAESILRRLVAFGACISTREDYFIITFKPQFRAKSQLRIFEACIELGQRLVGAKFKVAADEKEPAVATAEGLARDIMGPDGKMDMAKLAAMISGATSMRDDKTPILQAIQAAKSKDPAFVPIKGSKSASQLEWEKLERERLEREQVKLVKIEPPARKRPEPVWLPMETKQPAE